MIKWIKNWLYEFKYKRWKQKRAKRIQLEHEKIIKRHLDEYYDQQDKIARKEYSKFLKKNK